MKLIIAPQAERDLQTIGDWVAQYDPDAAERVLALLKAKASEIVDMPLAFPVAAELNRGGLRKRSVRSYIIFYHVRSQAVRIARFVHARRDYAAMFRKS